MLRIRALPWALALAGVVTLGACDDEATGPDLEVVAGTYTATTFNVTEDGSATQDILDLGGMITMTLNANGTTTGALFVPGGLEGGGDFLADLEGTWDMDDDGRVTFDHEADTFLRDVAFDFDEDDGTLVTTDFAGDAEFDVVLTRE